MLEQQEVNKDDDSEDEDALKKNKKSQKEARQSKRDQDGRGDEESRPAAFFRKKKAEREDTEETRHSDESGGRDDKSGQGLTEAESKDAVRAIADGLSRELRNEFDDSSESSVNELEAVVVAAFIDSLCEKIEAGDREFTEALFDEALTEALEDVLGLPEPTADEVTYGEEDVRTGEHPEAGDLALDSGGGDVDGDGGGGSGRGPHHRSPVDDRDVTPAVTAFVASNSGLQNSSVVKNAQKRGMGLLIGGIVGYIIGHRHGNKRAEAHLQPEVDKLEEQVATLYEALAARELLIRQTVQELASRSVSEHTMAQLQGMNQTQVGGSVALNRDTSRAVHPPSLVIPVAFATLLASKRFMADIAKEQHTRGKDMAVGGICGYMIGRRHGRKKAEARIKTDMEQLEDRVYALQGNILNSDSVIDAMIRAAATAAHEGESEQQVADEVVKIVGSGVQTTAGFDGGKPTNVTQVKTPEQDFVDAAIERVASSRKRREINRHKKHLVESGRAAAVGEFNLASSVFVERRLMDGTENTRKAIEVMNEEELLAMSQDMYVDGESAIELYDSGRVELEVLRESVKEFWRKTGNYEQTLRVNLKRDESAVAAVRATLEEAYRTILEDA